MILLCPAQLLLQLLRMAGLLPFHEIKCICKITQDECSYVKDTRIGNADVRQGHYCMQRQSRGLDSLYL